MNPDKIQEAIECAQAEQSENPRSMQENHYGTFGREPFGNGIGPFKDRGLIQDISDKVDLYMAPIYFMDWDDNQN